MKPISFVITLIVILLMGWGLLSYNRMTETTKETSPTNGSIAVTPKAGSVSKVVGSDTATQPSDTRHAIKTVRKERFEPNTSSAPDHRPLF